MSCLYLMWQFALFELNFGWIKTKENDNLIDFDDDEKKTTTTTTTTPTVSSSYALFESFRHERSRDHLNTHYKYRNKDTTLRSKNIVSPFMVTTYSSRFISM